MRKPKRESAETKLARLRARASDLADLVQAGKLSVNEAWAAYEQRMRNSWKQKQLSELAVFRQTYGLPRPTELEELKHEEFVKRRDAFNALSRAEQVEIARFVLAHDPELARAVRDGYTPLFEAFHELKEAEAFLEKLAERAR